MPEYEINNNRLREAVIRVIVFFDLFDYPLTSYEIWEQLDKRGELTEVIDLLKEEISKSIAVINSKNGFYFLSGRDVIIAIRQARHNYGARKIKIARRFVRLFSLLPAVKMIALANSLGQNNLRDGSDIDFFIISSPRRIWLTRLYCTGLAKLLNRRPHAENKKDKICLSFYAAADHLCLDDLRLEGEDPYFDYWRRSLVLLYNKDKTYERFLEANGLASKILATEPKIFVKSRMFLDKLEFLAKKIQLAIMPEELRSVMNNSDGVVINDSILKLYRRDRRREYAEKYGNKVDKILKEDN
ncbi:MAG: hypothetical protein WC719_02755 [Patescibacteria group bacterium]|jgi:hypothetical protein